MKPSTTSAAALALAATASAHSWVESVQKIAPNGTIVGPLGYARGWVSREAPGWNDKIPQWILPLQGQTAYSGQEILNKYPYQDKPQFPMLEAASGDHIAILHLENGHTSLPQNQPLKPKNRGTIFFYGTANPNPKEKLFDVHLVWNREGTGGDKRGVLLGTRNYDDGLCYQPNNGKISVGRAKELASDGAQHGRELVCQSDIKLPSDLKPGSVYTIYWYWDWPDLNAAKINFDATTNGIFPWAGTFMRGEKDPHGFTMAAIARNESYASTIDIKIIAGLPGAKAKVAAASFISNQNIYSKAIKDQMNSNYQVDIDANGGSANPEKNPDKPIVPKPSSSVPATDASNTGSAVTVTQTVTVAPPAVTKTETVYFTGPLPPAETFTLIQTVTSQMLSEPTSGFNFPTLSTTTANAVPTGGGVYLAPQRRRWRIGSV